MNIRWQVEVPREVAQAEARRIIEKLEPEHISSFSDLFRKIDECVAHANNINKESMYSDLIEVKKEIILRILDKIKPVPENASDSEKESINNERQMLVIKSGWKNMSIWELEGIASK